MPNQDGPASSADEFYDRISYFTDPHVTRALATSLAHALARVTASAPWCDRDIDGLVVDIDGPIPRRRVVHVRDHDPAFPTWQLLAGGRAFAALSGPYGEGDEWYGRSLPRRIAVEYSHPSRLGAAMRRDFARHRWPIAGARIPIVTVWHDDFPDEAASAADLVDLGIVAEALAHVRDAMTPSLWRSATSIDCSICIDLFDEPVTARIRGPLWRVLDAPPPTSSAPYVAPRRTIGTPYREGMFVETTAPAGGPEIVAEPLLDPDRATAADRPRLAELAQWLATRPPRDAAQTKVAIGWLLALREADDGPALSEIGAATLELWLLERLPARADIAPTDAPALLAGLRAYFEWSTARAHPQAAGCLRALDEELADLFAKRLADRRRFDWAKGSRQRVTGDPADAYD